MVERTWHESAYLRDLENHADDSSIKAGSHRQCWRPAMGCDGDDCRSHAYRLCECDQLAPGPGGDASTGVGRTRGTRRGLGANRARTPCRKRNAWTDRRRARCRFSVYEWPFSCSYGSVESASLKRKDRKSTRLNSS